MATNRNQKLERVLEEAALLQKLVPNTVLVGGSVAAMYVGHRYSEDHDHVLSDLAERFAIILDALESEPGFEVSRAEPGKIILGQHSGIEYGIRQLIRSRELEVVEEVLASGNVVCVPTLEETLRVKAYLLVSRNVVRDYIDVAALATHLGIQRAGEVLTGIDSYYKDQLKELEQGSVATALTNILLEPSPTDVSQTRKLDQYKELSPRWHNWSEITSVLHELAVEIGK
jgi:hypothetical protein